jgi:ribosome-associated toxin RatA of RatAB toxin-antitoxin module
MPQICKEALVAKPAQKIFDLVNHVRDYPHFLPWCINAEVHHQSETETDATLYVQKGFLRFSFRTLNTLKKPELIEMNLIEGPFKTLKGKWQFVALNREATKVMFCLSYEFSNRALAMTLSSTMEKLADTFLDAFCQKMPE